MYSTKQKKVPYALEHRILIKLETSFNFNYDNQEILINMIGLV